MLKLLAVADSILSFFLGKDWKKKLFGPLGVLAIMVALLSFASFKLLRENSRLRAALDAKPQTMEKTRTVTVKGPVRWKEKRVVVYRDRTETTEQETVDAGQTIQNDSIAESKPVRECKPKSFIVGYAMGARRESFPFLGYQLDKFGVFVGPLIQRDNSVGAMAGFHLKF